MAGRSKGGAVGRVEVRELRSLGHDAAVWDGLVASMPLPSPFLCSWWIEHAPAHEPAIVAVFVDDRLVGGLALEVERRAGLRRYLAAGSALACDHVDIVHSPEDAELVAAEVKRWADQQRSAVIDLLLVNPNGLLARTVGDDHVSVVEQAPFFRLDEDFDGFLRSRPGGLAKRLRRARARLESEGVVYERRPASTVDEDLRDLRRLHHEVFGGHSHLMPHFDRFAAVARAGVCSGGVTFHRLRAGDSAIASTVTLQVGSRIAAYQGGRSTDHAWRGAGASLDHQIIEAAAAGAYTEFDYLRGGAPYKLEWSEQTRALARARWSNGVLGGAARLALEGAVKAQAIARRRSQPPR